MPWILIALLAQTLWALGNLFDKFLLSKFSSEDNQVTTGVLLLFSGVAGFILVPLIIAFNPAVLGVSLYTSGALVINGGLVMLWLALYLYALEADDASTVVPLFQFIPVFGYILGVIFLQEILSLEKIIAGLVVVSGALLLTTDIRGGVRHFAKKTFFLMLGAAFVESSTNVLFKDMAISTDYWTSITWIYVGMCIVASGIFILHDSVREEFISVLRKNARQIISLNGFNEVIDASGNLLFLFAITLAPVALVQSSTALQPVIVLIGSLVATYFFPNHFNEKNTYKHLLRKSLAIVIIIVGSTYLYIF